MTVKKHKPTTNGRRNMMDSDFAEITTLAPEKLLLRPLKNNTGRNNNGRITVRHQDGGHKRQYCVTDFRHSKGNVTVVVKTVEYDPNRSANIALVHYEDGVKVYILAPKGLEVGMRLVSGPEADIRVGNVLPLENIPAGIVIHDIRMKPSKDGQLIRSAGTSAQVPGKEDRYVLTRLNPGEVRMILATCHTTIGSVGNGRHELINIGRAGRSRWACKYPAVRGSVMSPNDHPHGGGEGKTLIGRKVPVSPWGQPVIGHKTHNKKTKLDKLIVRRRTK